MTDTQKSIKELLLVCSPGQWKDFIFSLQTTLIESGHIETLTEEGRSDFAANMQGLYNFFSRIEGSKK